jgi:hypothetical protein
VAWMVAVERSDWLDPTGPTRAWVGVGGWSCRIGGRRHEFVDEGTAYEPGRRIAHRTVEGAAGIRSWSSWSRKLT